MRRTAATQTAPRTEPPHDEAGLRHSLPRSLAILTLMTVAAGTPAIAQTGSAPVATRGVWLDAGLGLASVGFGGDAGARGVEREGGLSLRGGAGYRLSSHLRIGVEGMVWAKETSGTTTALWAVSGVAYWYPSGPGGLWLKGGLGALVLEEDDIGNHGDGVALTTGLGRDFRIGGRATLGPYVQWTLSRRVEIEQAGRGTGFTEDPDVIVAGVTLVWR